MNSTSFRALAWCALLLTLAACKPKAVDELSDTAAAMRTVVARETARVATTSKQVVVVTYNSEHGPMATLGDEFKTALQKEGLTVIEIKRVDLGDPMHYNDYGWKGADFIEVLQSHPGAGAIVSLVGAPLLNANDFAKVPSPHPAVLIVATRQIGIASGLPANAGALPAMLDAKIIQAAVVDSEGTAGGNGDKVQKVFDQHYRMVRASQ